MSEHPHIVKRADDVVTMRDTLRSNLDSASAADEAIEYLEELISADTFNSPAQPGELLTIARGEYKRLEALRKNIVAVPNALVKAINSHFQERTKPLAAAARSLETSVREIHAEAQRRVAEAQRDAMAAEAAQQDNAMREAMARSNAAAEVEIPSNINVRYRWVVGKITPDDVPRDWCMPDEKALRKVATTTPGDAAITKIPGVVFERVPVTTTRT